jgi:hypothetical protein
VIFRVFGGKEASKGRCMKPASAGFMSESNTVSWSFEREKAKAFQGVKNGAERTEIS